MSVKIPIVTVFDYKGLKLVHYYSKKILAIINKYANKVNVKLKVM
jgi:hypothetical protein